MAPLVSLTVLVMRLFSSSHNRSSHAPSMQDRPTRSCARLHFCAEWNARKVLILLKVMRAKPLALTGPSLIRLARRGVT